jgi:hypothetical protein
MGNLENRDKVGSAVRWRILLIAIAICGLTVSLATRTFRLTIPHGVTVRSGDVQAMRQHMDKDGARWVPPVPVLTVLEVPTFYPYVAPAGPPLATVLFDKSLYNRPPPCLA